MRDRTKLSERQRAILRFMEAYLESHGFPPTIREIGEATGINSTSVVNYNLNKLVTAGHLSRVASKSRGIRLVGNQRGKSVQAAANVTRVPMYGQIVASAPVPIPEEVRAEDEPVEVPNYLLGGADPAEVFALRVKGDSMVDAMIGEGDIVVFRKQNTAKNGDMVAVWLPDKNETTLKRFYNEGSRIRLQPEHPTMAAIYVDPSNCQVQGKVLSVIRQVR